MNWLVYHIVSGEAFFSGAGMIVAGAWLARSNKHWGQRVSFVLVLVGLIAVASSSTPLPYWLYALAGIFTLAWGCSHWMPRWESQASIAVIVIWTTGIAWDLPFLFAPQVQPVSERSLSIIGDSVTAGMGDDDPAERWPELLAQQHHLQVQDLSHVGDTVASAIERVQAQPITSPLVIIEIGGNDLFGSTTTAQFEDRLDTLLKLVSNEHRQLVMFELPLPPFFHEYGRIQRKLAKRYHVKLIPKRIFLSVLAGGGSTLDSIHLSQAGHKQMAEAVWKIISEGYTAE